MIKTIFLMIFLISTINAVSFKQVAFEFNQLVKQYHNSKNNNNPINTEQTNNIEHIQQINNNNEYIENLFKNIKCNQIIDKGIYKICYSYKYKSAIGGWIILYGNKVNAVNIKKRPQFYNEKTIPMQYRTKYSDYTHSGYDRGHTIVADADVDYSKKSLRKSYTMANITLQAPMINRKTWIKVEKYGRYVATKLGKVNSITLVKYSDKKIKGISIPSGYYRIYYNKNKAFKSCFYYKNNLNVDWRNDKLQNHQISCEELNF
jgi:endonuclease G